MSDYEKWTLAAYWTQAFAALGVLAATIIFYRQLVKNDNTRESRTREEIARKDYEARLSWIKKRLKLTRGGISALQSLGSAAVVENPDNPFIVMDAYVQNLIEDVATKYPTPPVFVELVRETVDGKAMPTYDEWRTWKEKANALLRKAP